MKTYTPRLVLLVLFAILTACGLSAENERVHAAGTFSTGDDGLPPVKACDSHGHAGTAYVKGINCRIIDFDNYPRSYIVYFPPKLKAEIPAPVVFLFHGTNGDGAGYLYKSGWMDKAKEEGLILVSTSGLKYCQVGQSCEEGGPDGWAGKWHHYHLSHDEGYNSEIRQPDYPKEAEWPPNDVGFIKAVMADVSDPQNRLPVDPERFYASGFSSGAAFTARLAVELSHLLTAVGYSSAGLIDVSNPPEPVADIPVFALIGAREPGITDIANGGEAPLPLDPAEFLALRELMDYYVIPHLSGFQHSYDPRTLAPVTILEGAHHTLYRWQTRGTNHIFQLGVLEGLMHTVPNGYHRARNPIGFIGPDIFWDFFQSGPRYPFKPIPEPADQVMPGDNIALVSGAMAGGTAVAGPIPTAIEGDPDRPIITGRVWT